VAQRVGVVGTIRESRGQGVQRANGGTGLPQRAVEYIRDPRVPRIRQLLVAVPEIGRTRDGAGVGLLHAG
jgi:hypothetical protein